MAGLARLLKNFGEMRISQDGKTVLWYWDFAKDEARIKSEMTKEELAASEKAKWEGLKNQLNNPEL